MEGGNSEVPQFIPSVYKPFSYVSSDFLDVVCLVPKSSILVKLSII